MKRQIIQFYALVQLTLMRYKPGLHTDTESVDRMP